MPSKSLSADSEIPCAMPLQPKHFAPNFKKSEKIFETPYTNPEKYDIIELAFPADAGAV